MKVSNIAHMQRVDGMIVITTWQLPHLPDFGYDSGPNLVTSGASANEIRHARRHTQVTSCIIPSLLPPLLLAQLP
jgi:hypothetical protein